MWKTLGLTISTTATVSALEVLEWNTVADAQTSHKSQLAQLLTEISQSSTSTDYLYRFCVADFQILVTQVKDIIAQLDMLNKVTIPQQSAELWQRRGISESTQSLDALRIEFQQAVESGEFVPAAPVDVAPLLETENSELCGTLNEFDKIKRAIRSKWSELENQQAFSAWLGEQTQTPAICTEHLTEFEAARENLESICAGAEEYKEFQMMELYDEIIRMDLTDTTTTYEEFKANILAQFQVVAFPEHLRTPLTDFKPESDPQCDFLTDPIGAEIDTLAAQKKEIQDCIAFATWYSCGNVATQLQQDAQAYSDELELKEIEINEEIRLLLSANPNLAESEQALKLMLEAQFPGSPQDGAPTGNIVAFQNTPQSCLTYNNVNFALTGVQAARIQLDRAENFCAFVKDQMEGVCTGPFEDRVMSYMNQITGHAQELNAIVEWLLKAYMELGFQISQKEFVANFRTKFEIAKENGEFISNFVDPITIPTVTSECQTAIAEGGYIETLTTKAAETKDMFDFNVYLTEEVCALVDARIQQIITDNAQILDNSQANIQRALQEMYFFGQPTMSRENFYDVQRDFYESLVNSGEITLEDPGFTNPISDYPSSHCTGEFTWGLLNTLLQETIDSLTYEKWLEGRLDHQCDQAEPYFTDRLAILDARMDLEMLQKEQKLDELWPILAPEGQSREEFESINRGMFETAKLEGEITDTFFFPLFNYPDSCGPEVSDLESQVLAKLESTRDIISCNLFTSETLCARLDNKILSCIDSNTIDARGYQEMINMKLASLYPVAAEEGEDFDTFQQRLQGEFQSAVRHGYLIMEEVGDRCGLPQDIPQTCSAPGVDVVDFDNLTTLLQNLKSLANYNKFLEDRLQEEVQSSLDQHLTVRALLWGEITQEEEKKLDLLESLYNDFDFAANNIPLEQFITEVEEEFRLAVEAGLENPTQVEREYPDVPAGQEAAVQEERALIDQKATNLENLKDFNNFVKDHVCGSRAEMYRQQCAVVESDITTEMNLKEAMLQSVYDVEKEDGETYAEFCTRIMDEFDAEFPDTFPEPTEPYTNVEVPTVVMPEDCEEAETAQQNLIDKITQVNKLRSLRDWLGPRITSNEDLLAQCMQDKMVIEQGIKADFPRWTQCIADKIDMLNTLYQQSDMSMTFNAFIESTRDIFDELKDANKIILIDPELNYIPDEVDKNCPQDVKDQHQVGLAFRDVLQDCESYKAWCELQETGVCDVAAFEQQYSNNLPMLTQAMEMQDMKLHDLFTLKVEAENNGIMADRMAAIEVFNMNLMMDFNADAPEPSQVSIEAVDVPQLCGPDARAAAQTVADQVEDLIQITTYNDWLDNLLTECCEVLAMSYQGLIDIENMMDRVGTLRGTRTSLLDQLEAYKNTANLPRDAWEASLGYTPGVIYPDLTLDHALVDTPQSCIDGNPNADMAAQELYGIARDVAALTDEIAWIEDELLRCIQNTNNDLQLQVTMLLNEFSMLRMQEMSEIEALATILGIESAGIPDFQNQLMQQFQDALDSGAIELVAPQTPTVNIPPDADMPTQLLADAVDQAILDVQRQQTYVNWLQMMMELQCQQFVSEIGNLIDVDELTRLDTQIAEKQNNIFVLMPAPFPGAPVPPSSLIDATSALDSQYAAVVSGLTPVDSGISTPQPPTMCMSYTDPVLASLEQYKQQISDKKTECEWLDEIISSECSADSAQLDLIVQRSLGPMNFLNNQIDQCFQKIESISTLTEESITAEFNTIYTVDFTDNNPFVCTTIPDIMPACGSTLISQREGTVGLCEEFDRLTELDTYLEPKKEAACTQQGGAIINGINEISALPGCPSLNDNWAVLYQCEGSGFNTQAGFVNSVLQNQFDPLYDSFSIAREDVGVAAATVPDICTPEQQQLGSDLNGQIDQATREATLCIWLEGEVSDACDAKKTMLETLLADNQDQLAEAQARSETLLQNLFLLSSSSNLARFREDKEDDYRDAMRNLNSVDVGITIPSVPERCRAVTNQCFTDLLNFVQSLRVEKDFADWLESELSDMCMVNVMSELMTLQTNIENDLTMCTNTNVPSLQSDLYSFQDPSVNEVTFKTDLSSEFDDKFSNNEIIGAETTHTVPLIPDICMQQAGISSLLMQITSEERELSMCLAEEMWLEGLIVVQCEPKAQQLADDQANYEFELRIVEFTVTAKEDDLAMCLGVENTDLFRSGQRSDSAAATMTPQGTTDLVVGGNMGCSSVDDALTDLTNLRQMIIDEGTYSNYLDIKLDECTASILGEIDTATTALGSFDTTCASSPTILSFKDSLGTPGETDEEFKQRMIAEFIADDRATYPLVDIGVTPINPLPSSATPNDLQKQADFNALVTSLAAERTLCGDQAGWLSDQVTAVCTEESDTLAEAVSALETAQGAISIELGTKLSTLQGFLGDTSDIQAFYLAQVQQMNTAGFTAPPSDAFETIEDNANCQPMIDASAYRAALDTYNMDLALSMYVMEQFADSCGALDINADRVAAMTLRDEIEDKNAVLEQIVLQGFGATGTIEQILAMQGLSEATTVGAQTANFDLSQYQACGVDTSALESDIADVNAEYVRCKMLEMSATITLTDSLVLLVNARENGVVSDQEYTTSSEIILDNLFALSGAIDQVTFENDLETQLTNDGRIDSMLAQTSSQISADLEQSLSTQQLSTQQRRLALQNHLQNLLLSLGLIQRVREPPMCNLSVEGLNQESVALVNYGQNILQVEEPPILRALAEFEGADPAFAVIGYRNIYDQSWSMEPVGQVNGFTPTEVPVVIDGVTLTEVSPSSGCSLEVIQAAQNRNQQLEAATYYGTRLGWFTDAIRYFCQERQSSLTNSITEETATLAECRSDLTDLVALIRAQDDTNTDLNLDTYTSNLARCYDLVIAGSPLADARCMPYSQGSVAPIDHQTSVDSSPAICMNYVSGGSAEETSLRIIRAQVADCINEKTWLQSLLGEEVCPTRDTFLGLIDQTLTLQLAETTAQADLLPALFQFKSIQSDGGSTEIMKQRMFDDLFLGQNPLPTRPLSPTIVVPAVPFYCPADFAADISSLEAAILMTEREQTFTRFLEQSLESCCDKLNADSLASLDAAADRQTDLQTEINAKLDALVELASLNNNSDLQNENAWLELLQEANLPQPTSGSEFVIFELDPVTCDEATQTLLTLTLPTLALRVESLKQDLAWLSAQAANQCSNLASSSSFSQDGSITSLTGRKITPANCDSIRNQVLGRVIAAARYYGTTLVSLEDARVFVPNLNTHDLEIPTLSAETAMCCDSAATSLFASTEEFEQCANDVSDFDYAVSTLCDAILDQLENDAMQIDTGNLDAQLGMNDDFVQFGDLNNIVGFENIKNSAIQEPGCSGTPVEPLTIDFCGALGEAPGIESELNAQAASLAMLESHKAQNELLAQCLVGYKQGFCADEVADFITEVILPEEALASSFSDDLDDALTSWIALVGGEAEALEVQLRNSMCFTKSNSTLESIANSVHSPSTSDVTSLSNQCDAEQDVAAAISRYNTAFDSNNDDLLLEQWVLGRLDTVRATQCQEQLRMARQTLSEWNELADDFVEDKARLYTDFFSSLSTTDLEQVEFFEKLEESFTPMLNMGDLLEFPSVGSAPCDDYDQLDDAIDQLEGIRTQASINQQKLNFLQTQVDLACIDLKQKQDSEMTDTTGTCYSENLAGSVFALNQTIGARSVPFTTTHHTYKAASQEALVADVQANTLHINGSPLALPTPYSADGTVSSRKEAITFMDSEYCGTQEFDGDAFLGLRQQTYDCSSTNARLTQINEWQCEELKTELTYQIYMFLPLVNLFGVELEVRKAELYRVLELESQLAGQSFQPTQGTWETNSYEPDYDIWEAMQTPPVVSEVHARGLDIFFPNSVGTCDSANDLVFTLTSYNSLIGALHLQLKYTNLQLANAIKDIAERIAEFPLMVRYDSLDPMTMEEYSRTVEFTPGEQSTLTCNDITDGNSPLCEEDFEGFVPLRHCVVCGTMESPAGELRPNEKRQAVIDSWCEAEKKAGISLFATQIQDSSSLFSAFYEAKSDWLSLESGTTALSSNGYIYTPSSISSQELEKAKETLRNYRNDDQFFVDSWELDTRRDKMAYECTDPTVVDEDLDKLRIASLSSLGQFRRLIVIDQWVALKCTIQVDKLNTCSQQQAAAETASEVTDVINEAFEIYKELIPTEQLEDFTSLAMQSFIESDYSCEAPGAKLCAEEITQAESIEEGFCGFVLRDNLAFAKSLSAQVDAGKNNKCFAEWLDSGLATDPFTKAELCNRLDRQSQAQHRSMLDTERAMRLELEYLTQNYYLEQLLDMCTYNTVESIAWREEGPDPDFPSVDFSLKQGECSFTTLDPDYPTLRSDIISLSKQLTAARAAQPS